MSLLQLRTNDLSGLYNFHMCTFCNHRGSVISRRWPHHIHGSHSARGSVLPRHRAQRGSGHPVPDRAQLHRIASGTRGWREVITDLATAFPGVPLRILPFETYRGRPDTFLANGFEIDAPRADRRMWLNKSPELPDWVQRWSGSEGVRPWPPMQDAPEPAQTDLAA